MNEALAHAARFLLHAPILLIRAIREFHAWIRDGAPLNQRGPPNRENGTRGVRSATLLVAKYDRIQSSRTFLVSL